MRRMTVKMVLFLFSLGISGIAAAEPIGIKGNEIVDCRVTKIEGGSFDYQPPKVGSEIRLNLASPSIRLRFKDGSYIASPGVHGLLRTPPTSVWRNHQMFFVSTSDYSHSAVQLIVGAYGPPNADPVKFGFWETIIQISARDPGRLWAFGQLFLECSLVQ